MRIFAIRQLILPCVATVSLCSCGTSAQKSAPGDDYQIVILNGRVMDPETGRDEIANVGITDGKVQVITNSPVTGKRRIDATGTVVSPGFVDILSSILPTREAYVNKVTDGVTTVFGMHGGPVNVRAYRETYQKTGPLLNYGRAVGHNELRDAVGAKDRYKPATPDQIEQMKQLASRAIDDGAAGIGFGINYSPGSSYEEVHALFEVCAVKNVSCNLHIRYKGNIFPLTMSAAMMEVITFAAATGAQAQFAHLISDTIGSAPFCIGLVEGAAKHGVNVGFDFHPWTRSQTNIKSALYDPGWQTRYGGVSYSDVYVASTQEQLTMKRFDELRRAPEDTEVQSESIPEWEIELALKSPISIVTSDSGGLENGKGHPRGRGTFARVLGLYVREKQVLSLMDALRKVSFLPAARMEKAVPAMKQKGRLQVGADADIVVFDPKTIREQATYRDPDRPSKGVHYVLVNGTIVLDNGEIVPKVSPGVWLRHE